MNTDNNLLLSSVALSGEEVNQTECGVAHNLQLNVIRLLYNARQPVYVVSGVCGEWLSAHAIISIRINDRIVTKGTHQ